MRFPLEPSSAHISISSVVVLGHAMFRQPCWWDFMNIASVTILQGTKISQKNSLFYCLKFVQIEGEVDAIFFPACNNISIYNIYNFNFKIE